MTILRERLIEMISEISQPKIAMIRLRKLSRDLYPTIELEERDDVLLHTLEELSSQHWIRFPRPRTPKAWLSGDRLPCWVYLCDKSNLKEAVDENLSFLRIEKYEAEGLTLQEIRAKTPLVWENDENRPLFTFVSRNITKSRTR